MLRFLVHPIIRLLILFSILGLVFLTAVDTTGVKNRISSLVFETYIKIKPRPASDQLVFVDINDESLSKVGQWPWPRHILAELITNIKAAGARAIIFDGVLAEPDRTSPENISSLLSEDHPAQEALSTLPSNDGTLAQAIASTGNFVAGFSHGSNPAPPMVKSRVLAKRDVKGFILSQMGRGSTYFQTTAQFLPELQKAAAGNGSFMASAENDAVIRRTGLIFHNGMEIYPSLMVEGVRIAETGGKGFVKIKQNESYQSSVISEPLLVEAGNHEIPMGADNKMWVYFRHFSRDEDAPAYQFLNDYEGEKPDLSDKIIFIASSAEGLMDLRATPLGMQPGVRVHMNAMEQILQDTYLIRPYFANDIEIFGAIGVSALIIALSFFVNPLWLALVVMGLSGGAFWASWYLFDQHGGLLDPVTPSVIMILVSMIASILSFLKTELEKKQVRDAFGLYISPDFMKELTSDPDKLKLGGEIKELTIMFTDIRSFTTISEGLTPEELIGLMNDFLTPMSDLVMQNRGTIDKYMGDAMMAFWNAPLDDPDHARNACRAALGMQAALEPINEAVEKKAKEIGKKPVLLQAGIGINTGQSAVGNMGSRQRFAYSTLGDPVNLASRLEGQTKNYGVGTLVGEATVNEIPDFATLEMDLIQVKGKTKPVRVFALFGDENMAKDPAFIKQKAEHEAMITLYQEGRFKEALGKITACRKIDGLNIGKAYDLYEERCIALIETPPEGDWTGVFVATSK